MSLKEDAMILVGGVALIAGALWYAKTKIGQGLTVAGEALHQAAPYVDPTDGRNVVNQAVSGIGGAISGNEDWTLGTWLYDISH